MDLEIQSTNAAVKAVIGGTAPRTARLAAARGVLPMPQTDLLEMLVALAGGNDAEIAEHAQKSLSTQETASLETVFRSAEIAPNVLAYFAGQDSLPYGVHEAVLVNSRTPASALVDFAGSSTHGELLELLSLNQQLLIQNPAIIEGILSNPNRTPEAERRAAETKREFFEKERGSAQIVSELRAQGKDAAAEFIERSEFAMGNSNMSAEDALLLASHIVVPDRETDDAWLALDYLEELYEETEAERKASIGKILGEMEMEEGGVSNERVSMLYQIMTMGVKDRVRMAMKGDREVRNILIRDPNRLVAQAVANNPRITEQEIESIAAMRSITEDILRQIASSRQWSRSYSIMHKLVQNPRTPISNALTIMSRMQLRDLNALGKNRNVSDAVRRHAIRLAQARTGNKN